MVASGRPVIIWWLMKTADSKRRSSSGGTTMSNEFATASTKAAALLEGAQDIGSKAREFAKDTLDQVCSGTSDAVEAVQDKAQDLERVLVRFVRNQPLTSVLIAAGIGMVLGRITKK
jgi:ElaB/YqjD/DUF883 family membrane-anchored ribosome-binding protein